MGTMTNAISLVEIVITVVSILAFVYITKLFIEWRIYKNLMNNYDMSDREASQSSHIKIKIRR